MNLLEEDNWVLGLRLSRVAVALTIRYQDCLDNQRFLRISTDLRSLQPELDSQDMVVG
jgi:hypothetical protein